MGRVRSRPHHYDLNDQNLQCPKESPQQKTRQEHHSLFPPYYSEPLNKQSLPSPMTIITLSQPIHQPYSITRKALVTHN